MKISIFLLLLVLSSHAYGQRLWTEADQRYTVDNLRRTRDELTRETENLTDAQWSFREAPGRWTIGEVVEHLALWEIIWAREISIGLRNKPTPELNQTASPDSYYSNFIMEDKAHVSPDISRPTGFIQGKNNLLFFQKLREQAIGFADTTKADMRAYFEFANTKYPRNMHQVYIYQWGHVDRHMRQIRKIKANVAYPKGSLVSR